MRLRIASRDWFVALVALSIACPAVAAAQIGDREFPPRVSPSTYAPQGADSLAFDSLQTGMLLRLTVPGLIFRRLGVIESRFGDTLLVRGVVERELVRVPRDQIAHGEVSTGRAVTPNRVLAGGAVGLLAGLGLARVLQHTLEDRGQREPCPTGIAGIDCGMSPRILISSVAVGTAVGMVVAARKPGHRWRNFRR